MARIKLTLPDSFPFFTRLTVRISDVNYGNHLGNDALLSIVHEARMQFLKNAGFTEMDFDGASLIMSDVAIEFKAEAFYGDVIKIFVAATDFSRVGFDLYYRLLRESDDAAIAVAKTGMVCYDYKLRKVMAVPQEAKEKLSEQ